jgi:hypothetical protein
MRSRKRNLTAPTTGDGEDDQDQDDGPQMEEFLRIGETCGRAPDGDFCCLAYPGIAVQTARSRSLRAVARAAKAFEP